MARKRKSSDERFSESVNLRFKPEQWERLKAQVPPGVDLAVHLRELTLRGAGLSGDPLLIKAVAFVIGALSPEISPEQAEVLFLDHLATPEHEKAQR